MAETRVRAIGGGPAGEDRLGHDYLASTLVEYVRGLLRDHDSPAAESESFAILLEGPWGSGKSSILQLVRQKFAGSGERCAKGPVVVYFDAWLHQRSGHLWWALIQQMVHSAERHPRGGLLSGLRPTRKIGDWWKSRSVRFRERLVNVSAGLLLALLGICLIGLAPYSIVQFWLPEAPWVRDFQALVNVAFGAIKETVERWASLIGLGAIIFVFVKLWKGVKWRAPLIGRQASVAEFMASGPNALEETKAHWRETLPDTIGAAIVVLVDELDRCDPEIVVDYLNALQTVLRGSRILHLVAAHRPWLRACYDAHFRTVAADPGESGRHVGDVFLDKIFQLSVPVPRCGSRYAGHYARQVYEDRRLPLNPECRHTPGTPLVWPQDLLPQAVTLLDHNPRLINRFINDMEFHVLLRRNLGQHEIVTWTEDRWLAGWTLIRIIWPALAEFLQDHPNALAQLPKVPSGPLHAFAEHLRPIFASERYLQFCASPFMPPRAVAFAAYWGID